MFSIWQSRHGPADFEEYLQDSVSMHPMHPTRSVASLQQSVRGYIKKSSKRPGRHIINVCFIALIYRKHTELIEANGLNIFELNWHILDEKTSYLICAL